MNALLASMVDCRLMIAAALLLVVAAGCDSSGPSEEDPPGAQATIEADLLEHPYPEGDTTQAARLSGTSPLIRLDSAFTRQVVPSSGLTVRTEGFGFGGVFVFMMETCEGSDEVIGSVFAASDDAEPLRLSREPLLSRKRLQGKAKPLSEKTCVMGVFAIDGFGAEPNVTVHIERDGGGTYTIPAGEHVVTGTPAISATAANFEFSQEQNDVLSSRLAVEGPAGAVPLEVYRLNGGFDRWQAAAGVEGGYMGDVKPDEPLDGVQYYVFPIAWPERSAQSNAQ